jgi:hypothetical protein
VSVHTPPGAAQLVTRPHVRPRGVHFAAAHTGSADSVITTGVVQAMVPAALMKRRRSIWVVFDKPARSSTADPPNSPSFRAPPLYKIWISLAHSIVCRNHLVQQSEGLLSCPVGEFEGTDPSAKIPDRGKALSIQRVKPVEVGPTAGGRHPLG